MFIHRKINRKCDKIMLFTNARDEKNIHEWIAHHFLLGFDKIFIFDHLSVIPITSPNFNGKLNIFRVNETKDNIKLHFMRCALNVALKNDVDWMLYLDADEYLCLNSHTNIKSFLKIFDNANTIGINWLMFGSNNHVNQPEGLIVDNFTKSDAILNPHVKSFVRPLCVKQIVNPHFYVINDLSKCYNAFGVRMQNGPFNPARIPFYKAPAYIAHYYVQSEEAYKKRKGRVMDDGSKPVIPPSEEIHAMHNLIDNHQMKCKYSDNIHRALAEYFNVDVV